MTQKTFTPRPEWARFEAKWLEAYDASTYAQGLSGFVLRTTHGLIEKDPRLSDHYSRVLELGVGTMAHFPSVRHGFDTYVASDHDPKVIDWLNSRRWDPRVEIRQLAGATLPFDNDSFDRVIATHVLEHIPDPVTVLEEWVRVLRPGGVLSLILPSDPGMAWRLGRSFGPRAKARATGLPYDYYMSVEHVNSIFNLRQILRHHFPNRRDRWWPLRLPMPDINLIYALNCYV